jgi:hypothetical protein
MVIIVSRNSHGGCSDRGTVIVVVVAAAAAVAVVVASRRSGACGPVVIVVANVTVTIVVISSQSEDKGEEAKKIQRGSVRLGTCMEVETVNCSWPLLPGAAS